MHHPGQSHPVTLSTHFSSHAVLSHTRFSDGFIPDFFSSMQNLYTFSIIAPAWSLYLHTSLAILLSEVTLHVHNTPSTFSDSLSTTVILTTPSNRL